MLRRSLLVLGAIALLLAAAALAGFGALQTDAGRAWLAASLSRGLSSADARLTVNGISGFVPSRLYVDKIAAADRSGVWLDISGAAVELRLRDLLGGQLTVRRLVAASVTVARLPEGAPDRPPADTEHFSLPRLPVSVAVNSVAIDRLHLDEAVTGHAMTFRVSAHGAVTGEDGVAKLALERSDGAPGHARLDFRLSRDRTLALHLDAAEPSGAILQRLLGRSEPVPLRVAVHGDGALEDWRGTVAIEAGAEARIDAAVGLAQRDVLHVSSDATVSANGLLPPAYRELMSEPVRISTALRISDTMLTVDRLAVDGALATIAASGAFDRGSAKFSATAHTAVPDLRPLGAAFDQTLRGAADLRLDARGTPDSPQIEAALTVAQFSGPLAADRMTTVLVGKRQGQQWSVRGSGEAKSVVWPAMRPGLPDALDWELAARIDQDGTDLVLDGFSLRGAGAELAATARIGDLTGPRGHADLKLDVADLSRWQDAAGLRLNGRLSLASEIELDAGQMLARVTGQSQDLATGNAILDALIGRRPGLNATVRRAADGALALDTLTIAGAHVTAFASASAAADLSTLEARTEIEAPRLDALSDALGAPAKGAASIRVQVAGSLEKPTADIDAIANDLRIGEQRLDRLGVKVVLGDARSPSGTLAATLKAGALDAVIDAAFARAGADTIDVSKLTVRATGSELAGALKVRTDRPGASGALTVRIADLSPWSPLAGTALAGAIDARISLAEKDAQRADIDASVRGLRIDAAQAAAERIKIEARLSGLLNRPAGRASIDAAGATLADLRIDTLRASGQSTVGEQFAVSVDARGVLRPAADARPLQVSGTGEIAIAGTEQRLRIARLTGRIGEHEIVSHAPLTLAAGTNRFKVEGLDVSIGKGRATGSVAREGNRLAVQARLRHIPLALVELAAPEQKVTGSLDATLSFAGTAAQPDSQVELSVRDMRMAAAGELPPLAVTGLGTWKGERLEAIGQIAAPDGTKLDLNGTLPLRLDSTSMVPVIIGDRPLRAAAKGDGRLERWAALLPLGEDRIAGNYSIDLAVLGTPGSPEPRGTLAIRNGRYVNFAAGTEINDITAEIAGNGSRFVLSSLVATDGAKGNLIGSGALDLAGGETRFDMAARFGNFAFMRRDDITASGNGELRLTGTAGSANLSGRVRVERAEIRIPEHLPPSIPRLPVVEIDSRSGEVLSRPEQAAGDSAIALALDVDIPARAFVRGRGLDSEWRGAIHVAGTTAAPRLTGKLETVRGDFSLLGKRFRLSDSTIAFLGGERIDPQLAITAEHRAASITAQAVISGTAANPAIKLTSQPELPDDEVLARVLFGRSVGEMTPAQGLELAQAAATLAGRGGPGILDRVRAATGLDRFDISSGASNGNGGTSGTTATAGKYIHDRVFLGVEQGMKSDSTRSKVEVEITPNVTVESSLGNASAGVGVNWKWDY